MDIVTHKQKMVQCEVLTENGQNVEDNSRQNVQKIVIHGDTEPTELNCEVLTDIGKNVQDSNGHSDTEPTDSKVWSTERQWTDCRKQQWL